MTEKSAGLEDAAASTKPGILSICGEAIDAPPNTRPEPTLQAPSPAAVTGDIGGAFLLDAIKIDHRLRREMGDIDGLAASIADVGLLHPIVIDQDGNLLAGARRLAAFKILKRKTIPVTVVRVPQWS